MKKPVSLIAAIVAVLVCNVAFATGSMRCGGHIVDQGTTKEEVVRLCGEPAVKQESNQYWFYETGSSMLVTRLFFVGDHVEFIDDVSRDEMP